MPLALSLAFVIGRFSVEQQPTSAAAGADPAHRAPRAASATAAWPQWLTGTPSPAAAPQSGAEQVEAASAGAGERAGRRASGLRTPVSPEVAARVNEEASANLEALRPRLVSSCWPRGGLPNGRARTTLTYQVTFNPEGREIARGILDDRKAPAGEFGQCLRRLEGTSLSVSPPGTYVTLKVPVTYP